LKKLWDLNGISSAVGGLVVVALAKTTSSRCAESRPTVPTNWRMLGFTIGSGFGFLAIKYLQNSATAL
jgi:hypothetical protein